MADDTDTKPVEDDLRHEDEDYNVQVEPKSAKAWLNLLQESEDAFKEWNDRCDNIDKQYANLGRLADMYRDKEFQMFWANCEVVKPSIYAKPPTPVVVPKFKDRRPVYQAASEFAERCAIVAFDLADIDELMKLVRDDLALADRGVAWCRYESNSEKYGHEKVCIDFKNRRDFLHSVSRNWREVSWVAAASYLTRSQARRRFRKHSGDEYQQAEYRVDKDTQEIGGADNRERAKFWEVWDKGSRRCVWVAHGCDKILDEDDPHLDLRGFFPCPKPAYGTVQRGSLVPVPDVLQYRDQLEEINLLTGRIHALSDALEAKGFYPAGGSEIADAVQAAISTHTPGRMLVPISNWAAFGGSKEVIIWLPIDMISQTINTLVTLRKQVIDDIYQIMGLADIMRGATDPDETLGAQRLKSQYGSTRIKDKQQELVRLARDLVEITMEIMTTKFDPVTLIEMAQTQLPTQQMVQKQIDGMLQTMQQGMQRAQQMMQTPQAQQMRQQDPEQAESLRKQFEQSQEMAKTEIKKLQQKPTIDQVLRFLKDNKAKSFTLDIETDSTIMADEQMEKQQRTEFIGVLSQLMPQLAQMIANEPGTAEFCGEILKFATAPFRAGRSLDGTIDELVEQMKNRGSDTKPNPEQMKLDAQAKLEDKKLEAQKAKNEQDAALKREEMAQKDRQHATEQETQKQIKMIEMQSKTRDDELRSQTVNQKQMADREKHQADMIKKQVEVQAAQEKGRLAAEQMSLRRQDMAAKANERQAMQSFKMQQPPGGSRP
jgi:hypothetical protein